MSGQNERSIVTKIISHDQAIQSLLHTSCIKVSGRSDAKGRVVYFAVAIRPNDNMLRSSDSIALIKKSKTPIELVRLFEDIPYCILSGTDNLGQSFYQLVCMRSGEEQILFKPVCWQIMYSPSNRRFYARQYNTTRIPTRINVLVWTVGENAIATVAANKIVLPDDVEFIAGPQEFQGRKKRPAKESAYQKTVASAPDLPDAIADMVKIFARYPEAVNAAAARVRAEAEYYDSLSGLTKAQNEFAEVIRNAAAQISGNSAPIEVTPSVHRTMGDDAARRDNYIWSLAQQDMTNAEIQNALADAGYFPISIGTINHIVYEQRKLHKGGAIRTRHGKTDEISLRIDELMDQGLENKKIMEMIKLEFPEKISHKNLLLRVSNRRHARRAGVSIAKVSLGKKGATPQLKAEEALPELEDTIPAVDELETVETVEIQNPEEVLSEQDIADCVAEVVARGEIPAEKTADSAIGQEVLPESKPEEQSVDPQIEEEEVEPEPAAASNEVFVTKNANIVYIGRDRVFDCKHAQIFCDGKVLMCKINPDEYLQDGGENRWIYFANAGHLDRFMSYDTRAPISDVQNAPGGAIRYYIKGMPNIAKYISANFIDNRVGDCRFVMR